MLLAPLINYIYPSDNLSAIPFTYDLQNAVIEGRQGESFEPAVEETEEVQEATETIEEVVAEEETKSEEE